MAKSLVEWAKGKFTYEGGEFRFNGEALPGDLESRCKAMATQGQDPTPLFKFWEKLQKNPSYRSVNQLWGFLQNGGHPLTKDGNFLAYKSVKSDYKDVHSGKFDNSPGQVNEMPRNQISDDPDLACHEGFHVGALDYARGFSGARIVICEIDPADVVCVPKDSSQQKMRVCKYKVIGNHNGEKLSNTVYVPDDGGSVDVDVDGDEAAEDADLAKRSHTKKESKKAVPNGALATKFGKLDLTGLMGQSIEDLRKYAAGALKIVGASKIPGGKTELCKKILEVRRKAK